MPRERAALEQLGVDDIVFHYGAPFLRAVSRVVAPAIDWHRPADYPRGPRETEANDEGRLVRVDVIGTDFTLHRDRVAELLTWGAPGPLSQFGVPREAYLSPLLDLEAEAILSELDVPIPSRSLPGRPNEDWAGDSNPSDSQALGLIRREQSALRAHLLSGQSNSECGICGRTMSADLLVAGHILPRSVLTNTERWDFGAIAMLVCLLGCDALFENGYIVVDETGHVAAGRPASSTAVQREAASRLGIRSNAWDLKRATAFRMHAALHQVADSPT